MWVYQAVTIERHELFWALPFSQSGSHHADIELYWWSRWTFLYKIHIFLLFSVLSFLQFLTSWTFSQCLVHLPFGFSFVCLTCQYELIFAYSTEPEKLIATKKQSRCSLLWLEHQNAFIYMNKCWILLNEGRKRKGQGEGKLVILSQQNSHKHFGYFMTGYD